MQNRLKYNKNNNKAQEAHRNFIKTQNQKP